MAPYSASLKVSSGSRGPATISTTMNSQNVASLPRFNQKGGDKSYSPEREYCVSRASEANLRQTIASSQGPRSLNPTSRINSSKGTRNLAVNNPRS